MERQCFVYLETPNWFGMKCKVFSNNGFETDHSQISNDVRYFQFLPYMRRESIRGRISNYIKCFAKVFFISNFRKFMIWEFCIKLFIIYLKKLIIFPCIVGYEIIIYYVNYIIFGNIFWIIFNVRNADIPETLMKQVKDKISEIRFFR